MKSVDEFLDDVVGHYRGMTKMDSIAVQATHDQAQLEEDLRDLPRKPGSGGIWNRLLGWN
jgi:hypothetical protein